MALLSVALISAALVALTFGLHYEALRACSALIPRLVIPPRARILVIIAAAFVAHLLQICLYALAFWVMVDALGLGRIAGAREGDALDFFYYSAANFTTLGVGDLVAEGPLRLAAGVEALNGLVLITWSASFTYLAMERFWQDHR